MSKFCLITSLGSHCLTCPPQLVKIFTKFMYKYNIIMSDWYNSFSYIDKKIDVYVNRKVDMNIKYTAHAIHDLCEMRDLHNFELLIQYLRIK